MFRKFVFTNVLLISIVWNLKSQMWDIGTTWVYEQDDFSIPKENYIIFKIIDDTIINHERALKLIEYYCEQDCDLPPKGNFKMHFIKTTLDQVYYFDKDSNSFFILYDFIARQDDIIRTYTVPIFWLNEPKYIEYYVSIIGQDTTSGDIRNIFLYDNIAPTSKYNYFGRTIEWIGNLQYLFPVPILVDPSPGGKLKCFTDGKVNYPKDVICKLPSDVILFESNHSVLYPNPTTGKIFCSLNLDCEIKIVDIFGNQMEVKISNNSIDLSGFGNGNYYILIFKDKKVYINRFLKI
ncbi:MAG: T9SS type A sorting domain-containing protein [Saprospiraceae bacterium]|nr:T9SS type A sorting domain-containing protein [Saprospiraceae bacterium]